MLEGSIRILDFDGSVTRQKKLLSIFKNNIVDLKDLSSQARIWSNKSVQDHIKERIRNSPKNSLTFLGSNDYHHISSILMDQINEPFSVIHFDRHADWNVLPPGLNCGGWVSKALKNQAIARYILIGMASQKSFSYSIQNGNYAAMENDRLEIYPYAWPPSKVFLRSIPPNRSVKSKRKLFFSQIYWQELKDRNISDFFRGLLKRLPVKKVYITIDKDCLKKEYSLTNWQEGELSLSQLLSMLELIKENCDILGADISGDHSKMLSDDPLRKLVSFLVHPNEFSAKSAAGSKIEEVNEETNLKIAELLTRRSSDMPPTR